MSGDFNLYKFLNDSSFAFVEITYSIPSKISLESVLKFVEHQSKIFRIKISRKEGKHNILILRFDSTKLKNITEADLNKIIDEFAELIKEKVESRIIACRHLPIDKYSPNPPLPLSIFEKDEVLGDAVMTGVKFSFHKTKEDLKFALIDVSPCIGCGEVDIGIYLTLLKEMYISANEIINVLKKSEEYFKYFYKTKNA